MVAEYPNSSGTISASFAGVISSNARVFAVMRATSSIRQPGCPEIVISAIGNARFAHAMVPKVRMDRRTFLSLMAAPAMAAQELQADLAIIGAGVGGCASALAACRNGLS